MKDKINEYDMDKVPNKALHSKSRQYKEIPEGLLAEARELLAESGERFLGEAFQE